MALFVFGLVDGKQKKPDVDAHRLRCGSDNWIKRWLGISGYIQLRIGTRSRKATVDGSAELTA